MNILLHFMAWAKAQMNKPRPCEGICLDMPANAIPSPDDFVTYKIMGIAETHDGYCAECAAYFRSVGLSDGWECESW